jgi:fatty-acyl-CoA synthase
MEGLMMDYPLTLQHILWRMETLFNRKQVVTKGEHGVHRYTYGDFLPRVNQLAGTLKRLGIRRGDRVATLAWNNYRHLELYYAVPCMGAVLHTLNLRLFTRDLEFIINDAKDSVLCVDETLLPILHGLIGKIPSVRHIVLMTDGGPVQSTDSVQMLDYETLLKAESTEFTWPKLNERSAAGMCYTSGTTGNPKGVVYSHRSTFLHTMGAVQADTLNLSERDVVFPIVPMFHANCWGLPYAAGMVGAKLVFPDRWMGDAAAVIDLALAEGATVMAGVPTIWVNAVQYLDKTGISLPDVHTVICGGSAIPRSLMVDMDGHGLPMLHCWGMTETSPLGCVSRPRTWHDLGQALDIRLKQGVVVPGVEIRICDPATGAVLPWDGIAFGEIQVRGPWVASGYHNSYDSAKKSQDGWFRTGDVAKISPDGFMAIVDRTKDVIKSGGEWVSSVELEGVIMSHYKVLEAAVIGLHHAKWQERPVAYVVAKPEFEGHLDAQEILDFMSDKVPKWWLPDEVRLIDELPKTSVGKFDKKALRAQAAALHQATSPNTTP